VIVVNGRFLRAAPTGLHRVARALLDAARAGGLEAEVLAPSGVTDPRVDRHLPAPWAGRPGDHLWEQVVLPAVAGSRPVLSLANTSPLTARHSAVVVHDLAPTVHPEWFRPELRLYGRMVLAGARRAELVFTVSHAMAAELRDAGVRAPVHVVPNAVFPEFRPVPATDVAAVLDRLGVEPPYVVHLGWADPRKDVITALAAHRAVFPRRPHNLVLAGLAHRNFATVPVPDWPSVRQVGYVADDDLPALLTGAAALVYPSVYEGFGLPPVEAMACGTPAIVSDIPVLREATDGRAFYAPVGDVEAWAALIERALAGELEASGPRDWHWADAGALVVDALGRLGLGAIRR
jgi:glycosyltransferase involved in cell wall biosynthesis